MSPHRPRPRLAHSSLGALLSLLTLLAGCSNDPNPAPLHKTRADGTPWVVRYVYIPDDIRSLDPQVGYDQMSKTITETVYDNLLEYNPMKTDPYEVEPCLLETMPEKTQAADGSVTYHCRLKSGIYFQDDPCFEASRGKGREVVAGDVQYAFQRLSDPALNSPIFSALAEVVAGMSQAYEKAKTLGHFDYDQNKVGGLEIVDAHTFNLHLTKPYPQIQYWMAMAFTAPVPREAVEYYAGQRAPDANGRMGARELFKYHPVGSGPFRLVHYDPAQRFTLERNANYHTVVFPSGGWPPERESVNRPLAGRALPLVDEVQITIFRELLPSWLLTRQGYLDRMGVMKDAAKSAMTSANELTPELRDRGMKLHRVLEPSTFYLVFNMEDKIVGPNKKLRQALSCAYDPRGYIEMLYGGAAKVAGQVIPPGIFGFEKDVANPYAYDLEKAKRLIAEAGYPGGIDPATNAPLVISLDVTATGAEERQLAEYEQSQLERLGIKVNIIENTFARTDEKGDQGNFQIMSAGWGADYPDPENFMFLFASANFPPQGKNIGRYKNAEFDRLFQQMASMENTPERMAIIHQLNAILLEECPVVLTFNKGYYVISQPWAPLTQTNSMLEGGMKYMPIDSELRARDRKAWNAVSFWPLGVRGAVIAGAIGYAIQFNRRRSAV